VSDLLSLPLVVGLCPDHHRDFYVRFESGTSPICPECSQTLVLYVQANAMAPPESEF
jgi:hypothetical protein